MSNEKIIKTIESTPSADKRGKVVKDGNIAKYTIAAGASAVVVGTGIVIKKLLDKDDGPIIFQIGNIILRWVSKK